MDEGDTQMNTTEIKHDDEGMVDARESTAANTADAGVSMTNMGRPP